MYQYKLHSKTKSYYLGYPRVARRSFLDIFTDLHTPPEDLELYRIPETYYIGPEEDARNIRSYFDTAINNLGLRRLSDEDSSGKKTD